MTQWMSVTKVWHGLGQSVIDDTMDEYDEGLAWLGTKCHR